MAVPLQVWFLPWAGIRREVQIGPISLWPFANRQPRNRIPNLPTRKHLRRYFRCYVDHGGKPVKSVTVCSHGDADFRQLSDMELGELRAAVDALIFSCICSATITGVKAKNWSMGPPSAELFQLIGQQFLPWQDDVSVRAGSMWHAGWHIGKIRFAMPWSTGFNADLPDARVVNGFSQMLQSGEAGAARERIIRSLEWFRFAHVESDDVSRLSRIVMMATAFEALLAVPRTADKSLWIAKEVARRCPDPSLKQEVRPVGKKREDVTLPRMAWWAYDFYKLRNKIVHGDAARPQDLTYPQSALPWMTHRIAADLLYWELVTRELFDQGWLGNDVRKDAEELNAMWPGEHEAGLEGALLSTQMEYDGIHRALGWRPEIKPE